MTLSPFRADSLSAPHGFFTSQGGVSRGRYESLNCGPGSSDNADAVAENRSRVAKTLGAETLLTVHQIHSADALAADGPWPGERPRADAVATATPGVAVGALHADCAPVLFEDPANNVVAAAHAGWRGALAGITDAAIEAMESLGAARATTKAAIGPAISQRAYEVGPEFMDEFLAEDPETARFFAGGQGDRMQFDLPGYLLNRLRAAGVEAEWTGHCTYSDPARFFSYRRVTHEGGGDYGRLISAITPRP